MAKSKPSVWGEIGAATIGAAVGGVLGVLFAPGSGKKNRAALVKEGKKAAAVVSKATKNVEKKAVKAVKKTKKAKK